jgi:uncharacterized Tic20 family protein
MDNSFGAAPNQSELKGDEKTLALFSHLSLFLGGIVLPIIFWATNKDKSKFVTFHSLQAIWFHVAYIVGIVIVVMVAVFGGLVMGLVSGGLAKGHTASSSPIFIIMMIAVYGLIFLFVFAGIGYAVYMGIKAYHGELKKYPVIGNIIYKKVYGSN